MTTHKNKFFARSYRSYPSVPSCIFIVIFSFFKNMTNAEIDSEEEAYRKFIVICEDNESGDEKESVETVQSNVKTSKEQFAKIIAFAEGEKNSDLEFVSFIMNLVEYNEEGVGKQVFDKMWAQLSDELNQIGPPYRSTSEWRRIWTVNKYNKRKRSEDASVEPNQAKNRKRSSREEKKPSVETVRQGNSRSFSSELLSYNFSFLETLPSDLESTVPCVPSSVSEKILTQFGALLEKLNKIMEHQEDIIRKIDQILSVISERP